MIFNLLFASLTLTTHGLPANKDKTETPTGQVIIQAQKIVIPHIPKTVSQAHHEYDDIFPHILAAIQDIENDLHELYLNAATIEPLPKSILAKSTEFHAIHFFNQIIQDDVFRQLKTELIYRLTSWHKIAQEAKQINSYGSHKRINPHYNKNEKKILNKIKSLKRSDFFVGVLKDIDSNPDLKGSYSENWESIKWDTNQRNIITTGIAPVLYESWSPLSNHITQCANQFADLDNPLTPYSNTHLIKLKNLAKIAFLERCRFTLWLCSVIWNQMTDRDQPPPLKHLVTPKTIKNS